MPLVNSGFPGYGGLGGVKAPTKPRVFVSYHHDNDQWWYDYFSRTFSDNYDVVTDRSLDRLIDSDDPEYVMRRIREKYITGSSVTVVLCGSETAHRKYVDWEIKATLDKEHGLMGLVVPGTDPLTIPWRLFDNCQSGYADFYYTWPTSPQELSWMVQAARSRSHQKNLIRNGRDLMARNQ